MSYLPPVVCRRTHVLPKLFVFVFSIVVSNTYYVVFLSCFSLYLVYRLLPISLDCPFLIAPSVFSNVYLFDRKPKGHHFTGNLIYSYNNIIAIILSPSFHLVSVSIYDYS